MGVGLLVGRGCYVSMHSPRQMGLPGSAGLSVRDAEASTHSGSQQVQLFIKDEVCQGTGRG